MRNFLVIQILLFLFCSTNKSFSQDTLYLMSGKHMVAKVIEIDYDKDGYISYEIKKKDKIKTKFIEKEDVFSISYYNNKNEIIYLKDSTKGFILDQEQMFNYITGGQVAWSKYKTPKIIIAGGALSGVAGGFLGLYGLLIPVTYTTAISLINPKIQYDNTKQPSQENIEYYNMGYSSVAKSKNIKSTIIAGFSGIVVSAILITSFHIKPINKW